MTSRIVVSFRTPGIHAWPGVVDTHYKDTVGYLQFPHRHVFHFKATKSVSHADRDIEIIDLRNRMEVFLKNKYWNKDLGCLEFGPMSCEMMAEELLKEFTLDSCEVLEDGENGAIIEDEPSMPIKTYSTKSIEEKVEHETVFGKDSLPQALKGKNITFICSYLCSGKSTLANMYYVGLISGGFHNSHTVKHLEVSDVVRELLNERERSKLQGHPELQDAIIHRIAEEARKCSHLIVSGARQVGILQQFRESTMIWLDVPQDLRYERYQKSEKDNDKSFDAFLNANVKDLSLGLHEVKEFIFNRQKLYKK